LIRRALGLPLAVDKHDIVDLMNWACNKSLTHIECNKKAICDNIWCPLNMALLDHLELQAVAMRE
jgi:hypothetical protein